jgi:hypothetical protein
VTPAEARYYTVREVDTQCRKSGKKARQGAGWGAAIGCGLGMLLNRGNDAENCVQGAVTGAVTGAMVGIAGSCEDHVRYVTYWDRGLNDRRRSDRYEQWGDGCRGRVVREGYRHGRRDIVCREYETYNRVSDGRSSREEYHREVACREQGRWTHGYSSREMDSDDRFGDQDRPHDLRDRRFDGLRDGPGHHNNFRHDEGDDEEYFPAPMSAPVR